MKPYGDNMKISDETRKIVLSMQINELTEYHIYTRIAGFVKDVKNQKILITIGNEELKHSEIWSEITGKQVKPKKIKILLFTFIARIMGYTFALKLMENGEDDASEIYNKISTEVPQAKQIAKDEDHHEQQLMEMLDEERLQYVGSMVLGLSDALVELTGTLAGLTFALQNNRLVALSGLITGISATLSMTSSEYLSARSDGHHNPLKSSLYTGSVYLVTVVLLVLPYLLLPQNAFIPALAILLATVVIVILFFTYYISVAKDLPFGKRFAEMAGISLTVAAISFAIGLSVKYLLGIDI